MRGDPEFGINMWHGVVDFTYTHGALRGRLWYQRNADATNNRSLLQRGDGVYLGFTWGRWNDTEGGVDLRWVGIPYYFLIMLFAAALAIMWRPRKRINSRQAFPVEPARSGPRDGV